MAIDPMEVEISCPRTHDGYYCETCDDTDVVRDRLIPGTLSAAIQRLGWAAARYLELDAGVVARASGRGNTEQEWEDWKAALVEQQAALAEVRRLHRAGSGAEG